MSTRAKPRKRDIRTHLYAIQRHQPTDTHLRRRSRSTPHLHTRPRQLRHPRTRTLAQKPHADAHGSQKSMEENPFRLHQYRREDTHHQHTTTQHRTRPEVRARPCHKSKTAPASSTRERRLAHHEQEPRRHTVASRPTRRRSLHSMRSHPSPLPQRHHA